MHQTEKKICFLCKPKFKREEVHSCKARIYALFGPNLTGIVMSGILLHCAETHFVSKAESFIWELKIAYGFRRRGIYNLMLCVNALRLTHLPAQKSKLHYDIQKL